MDLNKRITAFSKLGQYIQNFLESRNPTGDNSASAKDDYTNFEQALVKAKHHNAWFTEKEVIRALVSWSQSLTDNNLSKWLKPYGKLQSGSSKTVAVIMAGNLPLVGFHDFLSVLVSGHHFLGKLSSSDAVLLPFLAEKLKEIEPGFSNRIQFTEGRLPEFDAVIATGSNNTSRYFEYYFSKKPNIIRKNRNAVAVLDGSETKEELIALGEDIFAYFGLGCRSVSKLFVPEDYNLSTFFEGMYRYSDIINHHKYANNYDYNKTVYLMSDFKILDNGFMVLKKDSGWSSPISVIYFERYTNLDQLNSLIEENQERIQCIVSGKKSGLGIPFGAAQQPNLWDYADGVDTIEFLATL
ncbi:MAG: acyl-CoA reductase [Leeuwenhoekiella sp.]